MSSYKKPTLFSLLFYGRSYVILTFVLAYFLNAIPWKLDFGMPDFVSLVVLFWSFSRPTRINLGFIFLLGLLTDVQSGVVLGQNAFIYLLQAYVALLLSKRMEWLNLGAQVLYIFLILFFSQVLEVIFYAFVGQRSLNGWFFVSSFTGALVWSVMTKILSARRFCAS